jgi:hypothetical protein
MSHYCGWKKSKADKEDWSGMSASPGLIARAPRLRWRKPWSLWRRNCGILPPERQGPEFVRRIGQGIWEKIKTKYRVRTRFSIWFSRAAAPRRQRLCNRRHRRNVGRRGCRFRLDLNCRLCSCLCSGCVELTSFVCFSCSIASFLCSRVSLPGLVRLFRSFTALLCDDARLPRGSGLSSSGSMFGLCSGFFTSGAMLSCSCGFFSRSTTICGVFHSAVSISE